MIKYIGSKRKLLPNITAAFRALPEGSEVLDLFSGTARVGHALKGVGHRVTANDHTAYAATLARCYVEADRARLLPETVELLRRLEQAPEVDGWFTEIYCRKSRYLRPENGARIEGMRNLLEEIDPEPVLKAVALTSLMEAADRVDSTTGVQMAYLKKWARRSEKPPVLRVPDMLPGPGTARQMEAVDAARMFRGRAAYLDPPYNQHSYLGNYHVWETLVRWDEPEVYGVAMKRTECKSYKSPFNSKRRIRDALAAVLAELDVELLVLSFNNEGYIDREEMEKLLAGRGRLRVVEMDYTRYVGAKIGIHDRKGRKVGRVSHLTNKELLFVVGEDSDLVDGAAREAEEAA